jgi:hypothetical protein
VIYKESSWQSKGFHWESIAFYQKELPNEKAINPIGTDGVNGKNLN